MPATSDAENHHALSMGAHALVFRPGHSITAHWSRSRFTTPKFAARGSKFQMPWCARLGQVSTLAGASEPGALPAFAGRTSGAPRSTTLDASEMLDAKAYVPAGKNTTPPPPATAAACAAAKAASGEPGKSFTLYTQAHATSASAQGYTPAPYAVVVGGSVGHAPGALQEVEPQDAAATVNRAANNSGRNVAIVRGVCCAPFPKLIPRAISSLPLALAALAKRLPSERCQWPPAFRAAAAPTDRKTHRPRPPAQWGANPRSRERRGR